MYFKTDLQTRETDSQDRVIEGYFIRFNEETKLAPGLLEEINPAAVNRSLSNNDIYALFNHDSKSPLGRTGNGSLRLRSDENGLWGELTLNGDDPEAQSVYAKVRRGDINGCSFGFIPIREDIEHLDDGSVKFIVRDADIREVSIVTFPAYPTTHVEARERDLENHKKRKLEHFKNQLKERIKSESGNYGE